MRKRERLKQNEEFKKSLNAQIIAIYGIMAGMAVVSMFAAFAKRSDVLIADLENITVSAFTPTTITLFATALFEYDFVRSNKTVSARFVLLTVIMSLFYTAFVCFEVLLGASLVTSLSAIAAVIVTLASVYILWIMVEKLNRKRPPEFPAISDGCISATRRK